MHCAGLQHFPPAHASQTSTAIVFVVLRRIRGAAPAAPSRGERRAEVALDFTPVDQRGQADEGMEHVQQLIQAWTEQLGGLRLGRLRAHRDAWRNLQENQYLPFIILQI